MHRVHDEAEKHEDEKLKADTHIFAKWNVGKNTIKGRAITRQALNETFFVWLHLSLGFHDSPYYSHFLSFVTIFTNIYEYMYITPRRTYEFES